MRPGTSANENQLSEGEEEAIYQFRLRLTQGRLTNGETRQVVPEVPATGLDDPRLEDATGLRNVLDIPPGEPLSIFEQWRLADQIRFRTSPVRIASESESSDDGTIPTREHERQRRERRLIAVGYPVRRYRQPRTRTESESSDDGTLPLWEYERQRVARARATAGRPQLLYRIPRRHLRNITPSPLGTSVLENCTPEPETNGEAQGQ